MATGKRYNLLYLPAVILIIGILTNDLHQQAFFFLSGIENWNAGYRYGLLYYLAVFWIAGLFLAVIWLLFQKSYIPYTKKLVWMPFVLVGIGAVYTTFYIRNDPKTGVHFIEMTAMLCTLTAGLWESCIQTGLLPSNTKYQGFFFASPLEAQIVDEGGHVYYHAKQADPIGADLFAKLKEMRFLQPDAHTQLHTSPIQGGHVVWREDVSAISLLIQELENSKTELMDDVELLEEEFRGKQRRLHVEEQNRLHDLMVLQIMPQIDTIKNHLAGASQLSEAEQYQLLWRINVLGAYIKRRANLILQAEEQDVLAVGDLARALEESLENLVLGGIATALQIETATEMTPQQALVLYDFFEKVVETVLAELHGLSVTIAERETAFVLAIAIQKTTPGADLWQWEEPVPLGGHIICASKERGVFQVAMHLPKEVR